MLFQKAQVGSFVRRAFICIVHFVKFHMAAVVRIPYHGQTSTVKLLKAKSIKDARRRQLDIILLIVAFTRQYML